LEALYNAVAVTSLLLANTAQIVDGAEAVIELTETVNSSEKISFRLISAQDQIMEFSLKGSLISRL